MLGKKELISNVNIIRSYTVSYNSMNVLRNGSLDSSVIERVCLICEKAKGHACRYLKTMGEGIDLAFHTWVVIERVAVEVAEL